MARKLPSTPYMSAVKARRIKKATSTSLLAKFSAKKEQNVLVVGDYNNKVSDGEFAKFKAAGYKTSWSDLNIDVSQLSSFPSNALRQNNEGVIDHIFINKSSKGKAVKAEVLEEKRKPCLITNPFGPRSSFQSNK